MLPINNTSATYIRRTTPEYGVSKQHSTTKNLYNNRFDTKSLESEETKSPYTVLVTHDVAKSFPPSLIYNVLIDIKESSPPPRVIKWLANYIRGSQTQVVFRDSKSKYRKIKQGIPRSGVLSSFLNNLHATAQRACDQLSDSINRSTPSEFGFQSKTKSYRRKTALFTTWNQEMNMVLSVQADGKTN